MRETMTPPAAFVTHADALDALGARAERARESARAAADAPRAAEYDQYAAACAYAASTIREITRILDAAGVSAEGPRSALAGPYHGDPFDGPPRSLAERVGLLSDRLDTMRDAYQACRANKEARSA